MKKYTSTITTIVYKTVKLKFTSYSIILIWLAMLIPGNELASQTLLETYHEYLKMADDDPQKIEGQVDSLLAISDQDSDWRNYTGIVHDYAIKWFFAGDVKKSILYGNMEISKLQKNEIKDSTYTTALYNLGRFYYYDYDYEYAIPILEEVIALNNMPQRTAQAYAEIAICYGEKGDVYKSIDYYTKGIALLEDLGLYTSLKRQLVYMAQVYRNIGDKESLDLQLAALEKADSLSNVFETDLQEKLYLFNELGNHYVSEERYDFDKAYYYYHQNLKTALDYSDLDYVAVAANNLANLYNQEKKDSALYYADLGMENSNDQDTRARLHDNKSHYYQNKGDFQEALRFIHKALELNLGISKELSAVPDLFELSKAVSNNHALYCLKKKAEILIRLYEQTQDQSHLQLAMNYLRVADEYIQLIESNSLEIGTRLFWREQASEVYLQGAYTAHLLDMPDTTFYFMEKNKAFLLSEEVARNGAYTSLPVMVAEKERQLKRRLLALEHSLTEEQSVQAKRLIRDSLFNAKSAYEKYYDSISQVYASHFEDRLRPEPVSLAKVKEDLEEDELLLTYIWNKLGDDEEKLIGLLVSKDKTSSFEVQSPERIKSLITQYQDLISTPINTAQARSDFQLTSSELFRLLLPTVGLQESIQGKKLLIIADAQLQMIPFEALVVNSENQKYLISSSDISYLYSYSFLQKNDKVVRQPKGQLLGYAPENFKDPALYTLKNTPQELAAIEAAIAGDIKVGSSASKQSFLDESGAYGIIHLATHANAQGQPWIAFSDEKLSLNDLYGHQNRAELVTLSACNTLTGVLASGEGVISLSRGFFYGGAKSVVSSLWNVNDKATEYIMTRFYANLKAGQTKSAALNNAKREYLDNHDLSELSPFYWSAFVLVGDTGALELTKNSYAKYLLLIGVALVVALALRKKISSQG